MKIMHKVAWALILPSAVLLFCWGINALFLVCGWPLPISGKRLNDPGCGHLLTIVFLASLACWGICCLSAILVILMRLLKPLIKAERFTSRMAAGEYPDPLEVGLLWSEEISTLFSTLNCLRDRLCNLSGKLKSGLLREVNCRREIERYDNLQLHLLSRCLPDCRRTLGLVKSYAMAAQFREERKKEPDKAFLADMKALRLRLNVFAMEIEQLFDLSRLERERWQHPAETDFPAGEFMRDLVNRCVIPLRSRGVSLETGFSGYSQEFLQGDRELLFRLLNILIRAIGRATGSGGSITFIRGEEEGRRFFELRDSRSVPCRENLAEEFLNMIKDHPERFAYPSDAGVSALGLGIVRDVANHLGCELQVSSDETSWTCLRFLLPAHSSAEFRPMTKAEDLCPQAALPAEEEIVPGKPDPSLEEVRVLLLDEDQAEAEVYARVLLAYGIRCTLAASRQELTEQFDSVTCDAVILMEPDQDPDEFPAQLRRISGKRNLPVIVVASQFSEEDFRKFLNHGRVWCLNMPLKFQLLCGILHKAVGK